MAGIEIAWLVAHTNKEKSWDIFTHLLVLYVVFLSNLKSKNKSSIWIASSPGSFLFIFGPICPFDPFCHFVDNCLIDR